jgi:uncharacterized membrane protein SirB2
MHAQCTIQTKLKSSLFLKNYCNTTLHTFRQIDNTKQKTLHEKIMGVMLYIVVKKYASPKKANQNYECLQALSFNWALLVFNKRNTRNKNKNIKM